MTQCPLQEPKRKLEHHFLWSVSALNLQPLWLWIARHSPALVGTVPAKPPQSSVLSQLLRAAPHVPSAHGPQSFLHPALSPGQHSQPGSAEPHTAQPCQFSPQRVQFGLLSTSFTTFSCSHFQHCSAALHAGFPGTREEPVLLWGQQVSHRSSCQ